MHGRAPKPDLTGTLRRKNAARLMRVALFLTTQIKHHGNFSLCSGCIWLMWPSMHHFDPPPPPPSRHREMLVWWACVALLVVPSLLIWVVRGTAMAMHC